MAELSRTELIALAERLTTEHREMRELLIAIAHADVTAGLDGSQLIAVPRDLLAEIQRIAQ